MIPWLLRHLDSLAQQMEQHSAGDSKVYLTARIALAAVISFLAAILLGPIAIGWLKIRFRERIDSASETLNKLHAEKANTPTMGGIFIISAVVIATLICGDLSNLYVLTGLFVAIGFCLLGAYDDFIKLSTSRNGIRAKHKLAIQFLLAGIAVGMLYFEQSSKQFGTDFVFPFEIW